MPLTPSRRSELRSQAHKLNPIVIIGDKGLTDPVLAEIDRALKAHELIKVRAATNEREARDAWLDAICERLKAHPVQQIGKVFVIYRERPEAREAESRKPKERAQKPRGIVVTERGKQGQRSRDDLKRRAADIADMVRKGKIRLREKIAPQSRGDQGEGAADALRALRPGSRTPSTPDDSTTPRRRPRTSR